MSVVNIPAPCSQNVTSMPRSGNGFYCGSCDKVVIDFTSKSNAEILEILNGRKDQRTCGYFRNSQVARNKSWPFEMVRFTAALFLAFGTLLFVSSCGTTGEPHSKTHSDSIARADSMSSHDITGVVLAEPPVIDSVDAALLQANADSITPEEMESRAENERYLDSVYKAGKSDH